MQQLYTGSTDIFREYVFLCNFFAIFFAFFFCKIFGKFFLQFFKIFFCNFLVKRVPEFYLAIKIILTIFYFEMIMKQMKLSCVIQKYDNELCLILFTFIYTSQRNRGGIYGLLTVSFPETIINVLYPFPRTRAVQQIGIWWDQPAIQSILDQTVCRLLIYISYGVKTNKEPH